MFCKYCGTKIDDDARFCCACGKQLVEPAPKAEPVYEAPKAEPVYEAPKAEPVYEAPKAEPVYEAPVYETPVYAAPQPAYEPMSMGEPKSDLFSGKMIVLIAAMVLGFFKFIDVIRGIAGGTTPLGTFASMLSVGAAVLVVLAVFKVLKNFDLFYAIAMFALAGTELFYMDGILWYISLLTMPAYAIAGVHYLLKGKVFNNFIKMIMAFAVWTMGFILFVRFITIGVGFYAIFSSLMVAGAGGLLIFSYNPNK